MTRSQYPASGRPTRVGLVDWIRTMQLRRLFEDDTAVSPVIGVILMVAITVILAAVIGTFVLGLGDQISENPPSANYDWDQDGSDNVTLTHVSGQNIDPARVTGTVNGSAAEGAVDDSLGEVWADGSGDISSGDSVDWTNDANSGQTEVESSEAIAEDAELRVIWTASGGGSSSTLTTYTVS